MSEAPRMPLARAQAAAALLMSEWGMGAGCLPVGSVRRRQPEVGDLDLLAPLPDPADADVLCDRILATCVNAGGLFPVEKPFTEPLEGLKPRFLMCKLLCSVAGVVPGAGSDPVIIPVQVFRYTAANRGWQEIMRTGPRDFGVWFLGKWKHRYGIPPGEDHRASVDGHLVDANRLVVPVSSEAEAFEKLGVRFIDPERRAAFIEQIRGTTAREERELWR